jgi:hypothetical protein
MLSSHPDLRLFWYIAEWLIRIGALAIVPLRRSSAATASWLLLIFFFPGAGLLLYLFIGRPSFPAARERRWRELDPFYADAAQRLEDAAGCAAGEVQRFARRLGRMPCASGNGVELIDDYDGVVRTPKAPVSSGSLIKSDVFAPVSWRTALAAVGRLRLLALVGDISLSRLIGLSFSERMRSARIAHERVGALRGIR